MRHATERVGWADLLCTAPSSPTYQAYQILMLVMSVVGVIAGILVAIKPRIGAYVVCAWLLGIAINLLVIPDFFDTALRDFGLASPLGERQELAGALETGTQNRGQQQQAISSHLQLG